MAGKRRPMDVNLSVVNGKHWTKAEVESRRASEVNMEKPVSLTPPAWLSKAGKQLFRRYAKLLLEFPAGLVSKLDTGTLARYCDAEITYGAASNHKNVWLETTERRMRDLSEAAALADVPAIKKAEDAYEESKKQLDFWGGQMVRFEKIARGCATEMGMTVSSRCKLVVPKSQEPEDDPLDQLLGSIAAEG